MQALPIGSAAASVSGSQQQVPVSPIAETSVNRFFFVAGMVLIFLRWSMFVEFQTMLLGANLRLFYIIGVPALLGLLLGGGFRRALQGRPSIYWLLFTLWLIPATLFSIWKGGSVPVVFGFLRACLPLLFVIAGMVVTWRDCRTVMFVITWASLTSLAAVYAFADSARYDYRLGLESGTLANPNDIAAHIILSFAFLLWVLLSSKSIVLRLAMLAAMGYGCTVILSTGSRGALIGMVSAIAIYFVLCTTRQRAVLATMLPLALAGAAAFAPAESLRRITSFSSADDAISAEALGSRMHREELMRMAVKASFQNPLFGVGPGQFADYEGLHGRARGDRGSWYNAHNSYLQVAAESGFPGLILYLAAVGSTFGLLIRTRRQASRSPEHLEITRMTTCILAGFGGFCIAIAFLNFAYFFYLPAMSGLAIAISRAAERQFNGQSANAAASPGRFDFQRTEPVTEESSRFSAPVAHRESALQRRRSDRLGSAKRLRQDQGDRRTL
ncbi:MAG: O-antigen ligase family protein [Bryobacteraceae bacterium]